MARVQDCHALTSYYVKGFEKRHNRQPNVNRYSARWGFDSVLEGMGTDRVMDLIDFYFTTPADRDHNLDWFFYHYEKLNRSMYEAKEDKSRSDKLMEESKQRAQRWRESGKRGITSAELGTQE